MIQLRKARKLFALQRLRGAWLLSRFCLLCFAVCPDFFSPGTRDTFDQRSSSPFPSREMRLRWASAYLSRAW